ncbi:hypothetical protein [Azospirillum sp. A29]|uniref:hypothetical protein n=1 Tax=Azospirillum sp. A29 TaxID=3160606 RepID=UPI0036712CD3
MEKTLTDRVHRCPDCGLVEDRDVATASVIEFRAFGHQAGGLPRRLSEKPPRFSRRSDHRVRPSTKGSESHSPAAVNSPKSAPPRKNSSENCIIIKPQSIGGISIFIRIHQKILQTLR